MSANEDVLDMFADDDATDSAAAPFSTDEEGAGERKLKAQKQWPPDSFVMIDGRLVPSTTTVNKWATFIEARYNVEIRPITSVGHPVNRFGCWVFEKYSQTASGDRKEGKHERLRYADATQMAEIYKARMSNSRFWELVTGDGLPGPYREGRPEVDSKGIAIAPDRGDHGPLATECEWIEAHDEVFVRYLGEDAEWPNGCWQVDKADCEPQLLDATQVKYVAHKILGMPMSQQVIKCTRADIERTKELVAARRARREVLDEFADAEPEVEEGPTFLWDESEGTLALFTEEADDDIAALFT